MSETDHEEVRCAITADELATRPTEVMERRGEAYGESTEHEHGVAHVFEGTTETVAALGTFVANEQQCCSFATYEIAVEPPDERTEFRVSGPDGTKTLLHEGFTAALGQQ
jgi:hypothetical protein